MTTSTPTTCWVSSAVAASMLFWSSGCAALLHGTSQTIRVTTQPAGETIYYQGIAVRDGEMVTVQKHFEPPRLNVGTPERPVMADVKFDPDPLLIADAVLLVFFVVPGLVALGVDFGTGAWRKLDDPQPVIVPASRTDR